MTNEQEDYINRLIELYKTTAKSYERYHKETLTRYSVYDIADSKARAETYNNIVKDLEKFLTI